MKLLLDENIPIRFHSRLVEEGFEAEHVILLGRRGMPDSEIRARLMVEDDLVLFTNDSDFEWISDEPKGAVVLSRVPQQIPAVRRIEIWMAAVVGFPKDRPGDRFYELFENGELVPIKIARGSKKA